MRNSVDPDSPLAEGSKLLFTTTDDGVTVGEQEMVKIEIVT